MPVSAAKAENERLAFIEERDGEEAMLRWAEQTLAIYVRESCARGPYDAAIRDLWATLVNHGRQVQLVSVSASPDSFDEFDEVGDG